MAAKNAESLRIMNSKVKSRELANYTFALPAEKCQKNLRGPYLGYLQKNESQNRVYISENKQPDAKSIMTKYTVLEETKNYSLLEIELMTGRTHQIRAHLASTGHPIAGDGKYGTNSINKKIGFPYQALYSYKLKFAFTTEDWNTGVS